MPIPYFGEILSLAAAVAWAVAVIFFKKSGETVHPLSLNLFKDILAFVLFLFTLPFFGESLFHPAEKSDYYLLLLSGALGIGIADTLFFKSLNLLGAGLSAIVDCLYSPSIIVLSIFWLDESLSVWQVIGAVMIVSAVLTAVSRGGRAHLSRHDLGFGILWGALAMVTMGVGIVMIKPILVRQPLLWITEIRLLGGIAVLLPVIFLNPQRRMILATLRGHKTRGWSYIIVGSFIGAYLSLILWLGGMKYAQTSISAALNQTSNIFVFIFAAWLLHEPLNRQRVLGIVLGVTGALIVTFT